MNNKNRKQIQEIFTWLYPTITNILCRHDPLYLIARGATENEYDSEAHTILKRLAIADNQTAVQTIVHEAFAHRFDNDIAPASDDPRYQTLAAEIWQAYQRWYIEQS